MIDFHAARIAMVDRQVRPSDVTSLSVINAMLDTPREEYAPRAARDLAYAGAPIPLAEGRWMMEPRNFAKMLDAAEVGPEDLVLIVGAGMGYGAAVAARLAAAVVALEQDEALAARATETLAAQDLVNVMVETGPLAEGRPDSGPFDVILVEGGIARTPTALLEQLAPDGRLLTFMQSGPVGRCELWRKGQGSGRALFDAPVAVLPGFEAETAFIF